MVFTGFVIFFAIFNGKWISHNNEIINDSSKIIGNLILNEYLLPFEVVSILLLGALIGAATIARRKR